MLDDIRGNAMELTAEFAPSDASMIEINALRSLNREEFTRIAFYRIRGYRNWERYTGWDRQKLLDATDSLITIDNSYSSIASDVWSRAPKTGPVYIAPDEPRQLRVFIGKSIVEVLCQWEAMYCSARLSRARGQHRRITASPGTRGDVKIVRCLEDGECLRVESR